MSFIVWGSHLAKIIQKIETKHNQTKPNTSFTNWTNIAFHNSKIRLQMYEIAIETQIPKLNHAQPSWSQSIHFLFQLLNIIKMWLEIIKPRKTKPNQEDQN